MPTKKIVIIAPVKNIIEILNVLILKHKSNIAGSSTSHFKVRSFTKMLNILQKYTGTYIKSVADVKEHFKKNGVAKPTKIGLIVEEYLKTGLNKEAEEAKNHPQLKSVLNLTRIYGIGPANAKKLFEYHDIVTVGDLKKAFKSNPDIINKKQAIGLKYHNELQTRIPRLEIDGYKKEIEKLCKKVSPNIEMSINGSYRRKQSTSGDIDILITSKDPDDDTSKLRSKLIKKMKKEGIIIETLANGKKKFMGIAKLNKNGFNTARHLDIIDTSKEQYPFAQLYFTGSGGFNSAMRAHALTLGFSLNEYTLSDKLTKIPIDSEIIYKQIGKNKIDYERDIFDFLGMKYVKPKNRNNITTSKVVLTQDHE